MEILRALVRQSWPIFMSQLAVTLYGVIDTLFASQLSPGALVVVSVSSNIYTTVYITFSSILYILMPYVSQLFGASKNEDMASVLVQGFWLSVMLCIPVVFFLIYPEPFLHIANLSSEYTDKVKRYLLIILISVPAVMVFRVYFAYCVGTLKPAQIMHLNFSGLFIKIMLSYVLIHGLGGMPELGVNGCAISTVITSWLIILMAVVMMRRDDLNGGKLFFASFSLPDYKFLFELFTKGFPIGLTFFIDFTSLTFIGLLVARMGDIITGSYQIASSISLMCYLVPLSIGSAASVLVARSIGELDFEKSAHVRSTALLMTSVISLCICAVLIFLPEKIALFYTDNIQLVKTSSGLIQLVAGYHFFDAFLTVTNGILRAYKKTLVPTAIYGLCLWVFGLGGGYYLSFMNNSGADGFWYGLTFAVLIAALFMLLYLLSVEKREFFNYRRGLNETN